MMQGGVRVIAPQHVLAQTIASQAAIPMPVSNAYAMLQQGNVDGAISVFEGVVQEYPDSLEAKLGLAISYRRAGREADTWEAYQLVLRQDPTHEMALETLGLLASLHPQWYRPGLAALTVLLERRPERVDLLPYRAQLYALLGAYDSAMEDYRAALAAHPTPELRLEVATAAISANSFTEAEELFRQYLSTGSVLSEEMALNFGRVLRANNKPIDALEFLLTQLESTPWDSPIGIQLRVAIAEAYHALSQTDSATVTLAPILQEPRLHHLFAQSLQEVADRPEASPSFEEAATEYYRVLLATPNTTSATLVASARFMRQRSELMASALPIYRYLLQNDPNNRALKIQALTLEYALLANGYLPPESAVTVAPSYLVSLQQQLQEALSPLPDDSTQLQEIALGLGGISSPEPGLLPVYVELLQKGASNPDLFLRIAQMSTARGDIASARLALQDYQQLSGPEGEAVAVLLLADLDRRDGNLDGSASQYESIMAAYSEDWEVARQAALGLAIVRLEQGQVDGAVYLYQQLLHHNGGDWRARLGELVVAGMSQQVSAADAALILNRWYTESTVRLPPPEIYMLQALLPDTQEGNDLYSAMLALDANQMERYNPTLARRSPSETQRVAAVQGAEQRSPLHSASALVASPPQTSAAQAAITPVASSPQAIAEQLQAADLQRVLGNLDAAAAAYEAILRYDPNNVQAISELTGIRLEQERFGEAERLYAQWLRVAPNHQAVRQAAIDLAVERGSTMNAIRHAEQLVEEQAATGQLNPETLEQRNALQQDLLQRRGFTPQWER